MSSSPTPTALADQKEEVRPSPPLTLTPQLIEAIKATSDEEFALQLALGTKMAQDIARLGHGAYPFAVSLDELALLLEHRIARARNGTAAELASYHEYLDRLGNLAPLVIENMDRPGVAQLNTVEFAIVKLTSLRVKNRRRET